MSGKSSTKDLVIKVSEEAKIKPWITNIVIQIAVERDLPEWKVALTLAIIYPESWGNPQAQNKISKATGLMQVMPFHHRQPWKLFNPIININKGIDIMEQCLRVWNNNLVFAVSGYNTGPNRWWLRKGEVRNWKYVSEVLTIYYHIREEGHLRSLLLKVR